MSFSTEWEQQYSKNAHMSIWPWSDLVSLVMRHVYRKNEKPLRVLELGCGAGANIPFFLAIGAEYYAIEGSSTIVEMLKSKYEPNRNQIVCGDFTKEIPFNGHFDVVVDRSSLTHNTTAAIERCLSNVHSRLKSQGKYIGIDWFSTEHPMAIQGEKAEDNFTRTGFKSGGMAGVGRVHFSNEAHLKELFSKQFDFMILEHKLVQRSIPDPGTSFGGWNFVAVKK